MSSAPAKPRPPGHWLGGGVAAMLFACLLLTASDAGSKVLTGTYPLGEIVFIRSAVLLLMLGAVVPWQGGRAALTPRRFRPHAVRAVLFTAATFVYLWSLKLFALPVVAAVMFLSPLIVAMLAPLLLGEAGRRRVWLATLLGLAGALLVLDVPSVGWSAAMAIPLAAAAVAALRDLSTRGAARQETTLSIVFTTTVVTTLASLATLPWGWRWPPLGDMALFLGVGVGQGLAYVAQVRAYALTTAATATTLKYSTIVWAFLFAWLFFAEKPAAGTLAGVALVVTSGLLLIRDAHRASRAAPGADAP